MYKKMQQFHRSNWPYDNHHEHWAAATAIYMASVAETYLERRMRRCPAVFGCNMRDLPVLLLVACIHPQPAPVPALGRLGTDQNVPHGMCLGGVGDFCGDFPGSSLGTSIWVAGLMHPLWRQRVAVPYWDPSPGRLVRIQSANTHGAGSLGENLAVFHCGRSETISCQNPCTFVRYPKGFLEKRTGGIQLDWESWLLFWGVFYIRDCGERECKCEVHGT